MQTQKRHSLPSLQGNKEVFIKEVTFEFCFKNGEEGKSHFRHEEEHLQSHRNKKGLECSGICKKFSLTETMSDDLARKGN